MYDRVIFEVARRMRDGKTAIQNASGFITILRRGRPSNSGYSAQVRWRYYPGQD
jgi:hypothetical protein